MSSPIIEIIGETITSLFNYFTKSKEQQCETQIVKDKKRLKRATNIAQQIFQITDRYIEYHKYNLDQRDYKKYKKLRKSFDSKD